MPPKNKLTKNIQSIQGRPIVRVPVADMQENDTGERIAPSMAQDAHVVLLRDVPGFQPTWPLGMNPGDAERKIDRMVAELFRP